MDRLLRLLFRGLGRVFPGCITLSQAIAFNMFLAFFPMLLLVLGVLSSNESFHTALRELPEHLRLILPPGSEDVVVQYFMRKGQHPWKWFLLGLGGTLFAGLQVMVGFMEGFRIIEGDLIQPGYWRTHLRALLLLVLTIVPSLAVIILTVFGRQVRRWLILQVGLRVLITALAFIFQVAVIFALSMFVLVLLYRIARPGHKGFLDLVPGAAVATVLWWMVDIFFGVYVRKMPYDVVYGGLATAIGLLLWMYLTAIVVLVGAAYNAEWRESAEADQFPVEKGMVLR
ncbi:MAG TPA: YihY/virulence factor BrkB family protein [Candidatus Acidoferrales bacterium]|nr:YihY/virulence factor BrkB family protein [Candidatus Acidoferrales bacterium]